MTNLNLHSTYKNYHATETALLLINNDIKKATFSKLRVAYNNVYRKILGLCRRSSASELFATNNILNFEALIRKSIFAFTSRLSISNNAIICTIQKSWVIRETVWKSWTDKLYL